MSFPAMEDLAADIELGFVAWKVYMHLQRNVLNHVTPVEVKVWLLADTVHSNNQRVIESLNWLVHKGYLAEHARGSRGVRSFTLAWSVKPRPHGETPKAA